MSNTEFGQSGVWKGWVELMADVCWEDHGGTWGRKDPNNPRVWYVIRHENMAECIGERELEESGMDRYIDQVYYIDLDDVSNDQLQSALESCGPDLDDIKPEFREEAIIESLVSYGAAAPMGDYSDPSYPERARAAARRAVEYMIRDSAHTEELLSRPVNKLGSTAREYARGDFHSAMARGVVAGRPEACIIAKMHGNDDQTIEDARPADYLPYLMGYVAGKRGEEPESGDDIAPEYHLGYERGERVRKGEAPAPGWIRESA